MPTAEEIQALQGTRNSDVPPWMSYAASLEEKLDPKLQSEVDRYAEKRYAKTSNQNQEELARQEELNRGVAKEYQWVTPDEYADEGPRIGRIIHSSQFINTLRDRCKMQCWYREHPQADKVTLVVQPNPMKPPDVGCWVQLGYMPEYSIMRFDRHGVPLAEKYRGWRTCLLQLIMKGVLAERVAHKVFGEATGPACERYNTILHGLRNTYKD